MQTTLLTVAVAVILALIAALVGPFFIDWGSYRSLFEQEASRLTGLNVRVHGAIDARLLPSPRLQLANIEVGRDGDEPLRARSLAIEFALSPLLRGEWRADEMRIVGPQLRIGIDKAGDVKAPTVSLDIDPDALSVERLGIEDGKITLTDATSGAEFELHRLWFNGDLRSLLGPIKGEGAATFGDALYPFRLSTGRATNGALRIHLNVDPVNTPLNIETDGTLTVAQGKPQFQGNWSVTRPVGIASRNPGAEVTQPWRFGGKLKVTPASALMEQVDFSYGSDADAVKLNGTAELQFGARPRFNGVLSTRQIDLDRLAGQTEAMRIPPAATIRRLLGVAGAAFKPPFPVTLGIGIDLVTLGGTDLQALRGDISTADGGWTLDRFEFRAPGLTEVRLSGRIGFEPSGAVFTGPADIASNDPNALAAWLEGRTETGRTPPRPLRVRGDVTLSNDKVAIERLNANFNRGAVNGRFVYTFGEKNGARIEASLNAPEVDIDAITAFGKAVLAGSTVERPREVALALDIGRATYAGIETGKTRARLQYDSNGLTIDQLTVENFGGANVDARGQIAFAPTPRGNLALDFDARDLSGVNAILARYLPQLAERLHLLAPALAPAKLHATLKLEQESGRSVATIGLNGTAGITHISLNGEGNADLAALDLGSFRLQGQVDAADSSALAKLIAADRVVAIGKDPGMLRVTMSGNPFRDIALTTSLSSAALAVSATGTIQVAPGAWPSGVLHLNVARADLAPLRPDGGKMPVALTARVTSDGKQATFEDITAAIAGSKLRGRLSASLAMPSRFDGAFDADAIDAAALLAAAAGLPKGAEDWSWSSTPFDSGMQSAVSGQISLNATRAVLTPGIIARQFRAKLMLGKDEVALEDVSGSVAGGDIGGRIAFRSGADGLTTQGRLSLTNGDVTALLPRVARPPVSGRLNVKMEIEGSGRSPATLIGSLHGSGMIALADGQFAGLDPRAFAAVTKAVDQGLPVEAAKIENLAGKALASGRLNIRSADGELTVGAGQIRLANAKASAEAADLSVSGVFDLTNGALNARLVLTGNETAAGARPDIFVALNGPLTATGKTIDVSGLTGWLTLRAIDLQSKKLEAIEAAPKPDSKIESKPEPRPEAKVETSPPATPAPHSAPALSKPKESNASPRPQPAPRAAAQPPPARAPVQQAPSLPPPINILPLINPPPAR